MPLITLFAVGDVIVNRTDPDSMFAHTAEVFKEADILFGNCETTYSERGSLNPIARGALRSNPANVSALKYAGFNVMSFVNNHHLDWGYDAFFDTLEFLKQNNITPVGAGKDIDEARTPAVIERGGVRVAFLAYGTVMFLGYEAGENKPGGAPLRAHTFYQQIEDEQPGTSPRILTFADREDLEAMRRDIKRVKKSADVVVIGIHWGLHFVPGALAMYEMEIGHAAIDAGADLVLGHHQHILKGIEVYEGKVIFHGLGNFAFDLAHGTGEAFPPRRKIVRQLYPGLIGQQPDYPRYPFPADARKTIIAKATISDKRIEKVSFLPCMINKESQPEVLTPEDKSFEDVASYLERISREAGFDTKCAVVGAEIVITS